MILNMFISYTDASVRGVGRWGVLNNCLTATASGSKLEVAFSGNEILLHFNIQWCQPPMPHLWMQLDHGPRFEVPLDRYLRIESTPGFHFLSIILKGEVEQQHRWNLPLVAKLSFEGYEADGAGVLPENHRPTIELIGDSITEGVLVDASYQVDRTEDQYNRPYQDDATATYAYKAALMLGLEPLCGSYGAVGVTHGGCGGVPDAVSAYPYCFSGVPTTYASPDYVLINHGTNDSWGDCPQRYTACYTQLLDTIYARHPHTQVIALVPFCGACRQQLLALIPTYNQEHNKAIFLIDTEGWLPLEPIHPLREGHELAANRLAAILKERFKL